MIDALWPSDAPEDAPTALQAHVSRLRKALPDGPDVLVTRPPGYSLVVAPGTLDLERFLELADEGRRELEAGSPAVAAERLRDALRLWRGRPLADLEDEPFARDVIIQLDELRLDVQEARIDADLACGKNADVIAELRSLVGAHPFRERLRGQLMQALYRCDRQAEALDVYADLRAQLVDELGLEPSATLQELQRAILTQDLPRPVRPDVSETIPVASSPVQAIVVYLRDLAASLLVLSLAETCAAASESELILAHVAHPTELADATTEVADARAPLLERGHSVRVAVFSSATPGEDIVRLAEHQGAELLVSDVAAGVLEPDIVSLLEGATTDVALVVRGAGPLRPGPVLVPFGGADHDWAALELGVRLVRVSGETLGLIGAAGDDPLERDASRLLADASLVLQRATGIVAVPLLATSGRDGIAAAADAAGLLVVGLPEQWATDGLGAVRSALSAKPPCPLVFTLRGAHAGLLSAPAAFSRFRWSTTRPRGSV